jgi:hypothetical protein
MSPALSPLVSETSSVRWPREAAATSARASPSSQPSVPAKSSASDRARRSAAMNQICPPVHDQRLFPLDCRAGRYPSSRGRLKCSTVASRPAPRRTTFDQCTKTGDARR